MFTLRKTFIYFLIFTTVSSFVAYKLIVKLYAEYTPETELTKLV